jgi:DNA-binding IclR family transcriptional regulator
MIHRATRLLRCFNAEVTELSAAQVAARLDVPEAEAAALLGEMHSAGLLECGAQHGGRYRPGPVALDMASAYRSASPLITAAIDTVSTTSQRSGHTGFVTLLDGADATAVFALPGAAPDRVPLRVSRLPARISASGRTLLSRLDEAEVKRLHPQLDGPSISALLARLDVLRDEGYEVSRSEASPGIESVAVAVAAPSEGAAVSLCIKYPAGSPNAGAREAIITDLLDGAADIAARVGDTGFIIASTRHAGS